MVVASEVDVTRLLNERKFSSFNVQLVILSFVTHATFRRCSSDRSRE